VLPHTLKLGWMMGRRDDLRKLVEAQQVPEDLTGQPLVVLCSDALRISPSVLDELVRIVMVQRGATELILVAPSREVLANITEAMERHGMAGRMRQERAAVLGVG
jgi:hypothetical protein